MNRYSNRFQQSPRGYPSTGYIPSQITSDGPLFRELRRKENDEKRLLCMTGSAYRKYKKRQRHLSAT